MTKIIHLTCDPNLSDLEINIGIDSIEEFFNFSNKLGEIVSNVIYSSEQYLNVGLINSRGGQLHSGEIIDFMTLNTPNNFENQYQVFLTNKDIYDKRASWLLGNSVEGVGAVVSSARFIQGNHFLDECYKINIMHELGHVFGLIPEERNSNVQEFKNGGKHCANKCIMRQGDSIEDWIKMTADKLKYGPFCKECSDYLRA